MSGFAEWMAGRRPPPPPELTAALSPVASESGGGGAASTPAETAERLVSEAIVRLDRARARTGRVRDSAFDLLAADALITYACEAALESDDPDAALERILRVGEPR